MQLADEGFWEWARVRDSPECEVGVVPVKPYGVVVLVPVAQFGGFRKFWQHLLVEAVSRELLGNGRRQAWPRLLRDFSRVV